MEAFATSPTFWIAVAYLVGAIPMGVVVAQSRGIDLRKVGSGNIGATNAVRAMGGRWGLFVFVLDAAKAAVPVHFASRPGSLAAHDDAETWIAAVALAAVVGHMFPIYLKLRGGKGVACAFGSILAIDPFVAAGGVVLYAQGLALTRKSAVGSLTAVTGMTIAVLLADRDPAERVLVVVLALLIGARHRSNISAMLREGSNSGSRSDETR